MAEWCLHCAIYELLAERPKLTADEALSALLQVVVDIEAGAPNEEIRDAYRRVVDRCLIVRRAAAGRNPAAEALH